MYTAGCTTEPNEEFIVQLPCIWPKMGHLQKIKSHVCSIGSKITGIFVNLLKIDPKDPR